MEMHAGWTSLIERILIAGYAILTNAFAKTDKRTQVLAYSLLARSLSNLRAMALLLSSKQIVEARILVRCCLENEFFLAALAANPDEFWAKMQEDDAKHRQMKGKLYFESDDIDETIARRLRDWMEKSKAEFPKPRLISAKELAESQPMYFAYSQFSSDAVHASITSLRRHVVEEPGRVARFSIAATLDPSEVVSTYKWGCMTLIRSCGRVNELVGKPQEDGMLESISEFEILMKSL